MKQVLLPPFQSGYQSLVRVGLSPLHHATAGQSFEVERFSPLPAVYQDKKNHIHLVATDSLATYLAWELDLSRLAAIHQWLPLAGRQGPARSLHKHAMVGLQLVLTQDVSLHLLWQGNLMYLKPLPMFLLDQDFWREHLCNDAKLHQEACGLLLSYVWLVTQESDLCIAHTTGLIPPWLQWTDWVTLTRSFLTVINHRSLEQVDRRYLYGTLRLGRVNWIYRLTGRDVMRGYLYGYNRYSTFLKANFAWMAVVFLYMTVVLSAMQVGLATEQLGTNPAFQDASRGFTIFSILTPLLVVALVGLLLLVWFISNINSTRRRLQEMKAYRTQFMGKPSESEV